MNAIRDSLIHAMREALADRSVLAEPGTPPDRYPTLRVSRESTGEWYVHLQGRAGPSYDGTPNEVFVSVELHADQVDWSRATMTLPDGTSAIDEDLRQAVAAKAQAAHVEANLDRWADVVLDTLRKPVSSSAHPDEYRLRG
jgi:hypothetical protein